MRPSSLTRLALSVVQRDDIRRSCAGILPDEGLIRLTGVPGRLAVQRMARRVSGTSLP